MTAWPGSGYRSWLIFLWLQVAVVLMEEYKDSEDDEGYEGQLLLLPFQRALSRIAYRLLGGAFGTCSGTALLAVGFHL